MAVALTHAVSPMISRCELSHLERRPMDFNLAVKQHEDYCALLRDCGVEPWCLGFTNGGHPRHPLYVRSNKVLEPFEASP